MPWWEMLLFFAAVLLAIWGFASIVAFRTRTLTRRTDRTAENMYDNYADPPRKHASPPRKHASEHGGTRSG